jgi:hypothetical protein
LFEKEFIKQLPVEFRPDFEALIREVIATDKQSEPLIVDYGEAGRLIGTTYEGVRKRVKKGDLLASRRRGRFVGIAMKRNSAIRGREQAGPARSLGYGKHGR